MSNIKNLLRGYWVIPAVLLIELYLMFCVLQVGLVPSASMEPTLPIGALYIGNRLDHSFDRGDIVCFYSEESGINMVKRIIGIGGDCITIENGTVSVNGNVQSEPYLAAQNSTESPVASFTVPDGCVFLLGDNRTNSLDARYWDNPYISTQSILSTYICRLSVPTTDSNPMLYSCVALGGFALLGITLAYDKVKKIPKSKKK